jgi:hypothetical protein
MVSGATGTLGGGGGRLEGGASPFDVLDLRFFSLLFLSLSLSLEPSFFVLLDLRLSTLGAFSSPLRGDNGSSSAGSSAFKVKWQLTRSGPNLFR